MDSELFGDLVKVGSTDESDGAFLPQVFQQLEHLFRGFLQI
jgi:hypothetical protein